MTVVEHDRSNILGLISLADVAEGPARGTGMKSGVARRVLSMRFFFHVVK